MVISIIGMLSSVVLVSLQSARDKGRVASIQVFEGNLYRTWGVDAAAMFDFNDSVITATPSNFSLTNTAGYAGSVSCTSAEIRDVSSISGSGGNIASLGRVFLSTASASCSNSTYNFTSAKFDATNGSISFWVYPTALNSTNNIGYVKGMWVSLDANRRVIFKDASGNVALNSTKSLPVNQWSHVLISWYTNNTPTNERLLIYIDGKKDANSDSSGVSFPTNDTGLYVAGWSSSSFVGYLDRFAIYTKSIQNP